jgi:hypothetical protein
MNSVQIKPFRIGTNEHRHFPRGVAPLAGDLENRVPRQAVRDNLVSFPSQVPVFGKQSRPDLQQQIVVLHFVRAWTMDDIAKRYGLGRQRMGQILTAWWIRAVKEGYLQAIEPEHPLFQRVRLERTNQFADFPVGVSCLVERASKMVPGPIAAQIAPAPEIQEMQPAMPTVSELRKSNLEEELHAIVGVLDNQLRICSKPINGNIDSCERLLARAKVLCVRLAAQGEDAHSNEEWRTASISAAKELFQRFHKHAAERSRLPSKLAFGQGGKNKQVRRIPSV